ncbi:DDE 3 domain-containing protein [Aphis craccivora]|uniref:DDE 3 domain-containing protein n=1 Tax=Aphis craccivora TaxID=307492 RepID=A0A6G0YCQ5_APHCR|nr:DDE 3 domain-containing protein [Aphis craccivora]
MRFTEPTGKGDRPIVCHARAAKFVKTCQSRGRKYTKVEHKKFDVQTFLKNKGKLELNSRKGLKLQNHGRKAISHEEFNFPPYYCQYNKIKLIWVQAKVGDLVSKNITFKMIDIESLKITRKNVYIQRSFKTSTMKNEVL